ncbi:unnamed protein product [Nezara viridula]|uniref:Nucleoside diphosphate kinase n=1 Tax=Nezara viridula TaxID=85310 RepID=A0A9P0MNE4_NEZVI|nr:unnamed protein product [Nezara viridula]
MKYFPPFTLELTLALIKPHAAKVPYVVKAIERKIIKNKFYIVKRSHCVMHLDHASRMYEEHKGKSFYKRLVEMMTSGPIEAFILAREDGIRTWRGLMGPTRALDAQYTQPTSLRGLYGLSNTRNATHGSDSPQSVFKEAGVFFPYFDICDWYDKDEEYFRNGYVRFCDETSVHVKDENDAPKDLKVKCD